MDQPPAESFNIYASSPDVEAPRGFAKPVTQPVLNADVQLGRLEANQARTLAFPSSGAPMSATPIIELAQNAEMAYHHNESTYQT